MALALLTGALISGCSVTSDSFIAVAQETVVEYCKLDINTRKIIRRKINEPLQEGFIAITCSGDL